MSTFNASWSDVLSTVYSPPNELQIGHVRELDEWLTIARQAFEADPARPVLLPVRVNGRSDYYAIAPDSDQSRLLRRYLSAAVGPPWSTFNGSSMAELPQTTPLDQAVLSCVGGSADQVYRFEVPATSRAAVRSALRGMMERLAEVPNRSIALTAPLGRLFGDFDEACAGQRRRSAELALQQLIADHRITARNQLFLKLQFLAAFEEWEQMEDLTSSTEILRLRRPALVSDALARLALSGVSQPVTVDEFQPTAERFGALVPSVRDIRSQQGADYYCLWAAACGEDRDAVANRVAEIGWPSSVLMGADAVHERTSQQRSPLSDLTVAVRNAVEQGRYDAAVEILSNTAPIAEMFGLVLDLVIAARGKSAIQLLDRYRAEFEVPGRGLVGPVDRDTAEQELPDLLESLARPDLDPAQAERLRTWIREDGPAVATRPGVIAEAARTLQRLLNTVSKSALDLLIDSCLDLATALRQARFEGPDYRVFGLAVLELWAFSSGFEERYRMERVIDLTSDVLERGISPEQFDDVVEYLRACWDPFLTDVDCAIGIEVIESLLNYSAAGADAVRPFASPILTRIGPHNAHRIGQNDIDVARLLALEVGLDLGDLSIDTASPQPSFQVNRTVLIYSLCPRASARAVAIATARHPGLVIETNDDHVATDRLRQQVRRCDLVVITDRAAKHAAVDAIKSHLDGRQLEYALGRGSSSIVSAIETMLHRPGISDAA